MPAIIAVPSTGILSFDGLVSTLVDDASPTNYALKTDRSIEQNAIASGYWVVNGAATNYEVRATLTGGGTITGSATGSWLDFTANRLWQRSTGAPVLTIEVRDKYSLTVMKSVSIQLGT